MEITKTTVQESLKGIFSGKTFNNSDLELARKNLAETYKTLKNGGSNVDDVINSIHADLVAFNVVFEVQKNRKASNGNRILPYPEIADFFSNARLLKTFVKEIEVSGLLS